MSQLWPNTKRKARIARPLCGYRTLGGGSSTRNRVPFHKLTQWLAYSILDVMERVMKWRIVGYHELTGEL